MIRFGKTDQARPRQVFQCHFELNDGTEGRHRFREVIPRLMDSDPTCEECGGPTDEWMGERVMERYWFPAKDMARALAKVAAGESYRRAAQELRQMSDREADPFEARRMKTAAAVQQLLATGNPRDERRAYRMQAANPARTYSNAAHVVEWMVETFAGALHEKLAPQTWPEGGILAVDALKLNLLGRHKYVDSNGDIQRQPKDDEGSYVVPPGGVIPPSVERIETDVIEMLDPDDEADGKVMKLFADLFTPPDLRPGTQGGVPCWQVLAAYGYQPNAAGEFPRDQIVGKPWLFRAYYRPNGLTWAHFFRQLPGRPAYVLSDMAHEIRMGVELAWPDPKERPQLLSCEYHVIKALERRVAGDSQLEQQSSLVFQTWGRRVQGVYQPKIPNGKPGSILRLWHFYEFRRLAKEAERPEFKSLFRRPTWRRIMAQVVSRDGTLRYSTGAVENALYDLVQPKLESRRHYLKNRFRTNRLLDLFQLNALHVANQDTLLKALEETLRDRGATPKQSRAVDDSRQPASLRTPVTDAELTAVGLPDHAGYVEFRRKRKSKLTKQRRKFRYRHDPEFRAKDDHKRLERRHRNDPGGRARQLWYGRHLETQRQAARERKAAARASDPDKIREQDRHYRQVKQLAQEAGLHRREARAILEALGWDLAAARQSLQASKLSQNGRADA